MSGTFVTVYTSEPDTMKMKNLQYTKKRCFNNEMYRNYRSNGTGSCKNQGKNCRMSQLHPEPVWISMRELWKERK